MSLKRQFLLISILSSVQLFAQDTLNIYDLSLEDLSKVTVYSTTRIDSEEASDAPANVVVISKDHIKERGYQSLIDVFEDLPDFKVDRGVDPRWMNDITVRGVRYSDKLIILLDGVRISSPTNEIMPIFENYPLYMAEQIEIVYGPASALYGADAFVGVVNIVSKKPDAKPSLSGSLSGGMYQTVNANLFLTQKINDEWDFSLGTHFFYDKQPDLSNDFPDDYALLDEQLALGTFYTFFGDTITPVASVDPERGNPLSASSIYGRIANKNFSFSYYHNHGHNPTSAGNTPSNSVYNEEQFFGHNIRMITGKYDFKIGKHLATSQLTYSRYSLEAESNFRNVFTALEPAYKYARSRKFKAEQLFVFQLTEKLKLTSGITHEWFYSIPRTNDLASPVVNDKIEDAIIVNSVAPNNLRGIPAELITTSYNNIGGMSQLMWQNEKWDLILGVRADKDERYDLTVNPRAGMIVRPIPKLTFKALYGTAYLAPSPQNINDRFGVFQTDDEGLTYSADFFQLPNPELQPQTVSTGELNTKYFIQPNLSVDISAYYSQVKNSINPVNSVNHRSRVEEIYPNLEYEHAGETYQIGVIQINDNLGESNIYGTTVTINYLWRPQKDLKGDFYLISSFVEGNTDIDEDGPSEVRNLPGISSNITRLGATIVKGNFSINARLSFLTKQRTIGVSTVKDEDNDGNRFNDVKYQEVDGYHRLDMHFVYSLNEKISFNINGRNLTNQKYRNVNIGASPDGAGGLGAASLEFSRGTPQNLIRITGGINFKF